MFEGVMLTAREWGMLAEVLLLTLLFPAAAVVGWYSGELAAWRERRRMARWLADHEAGRQMGWGRSYVRGRRPPW